MFSFAVVVLILLGIVALLALVIALLVHYWRRMIDSSLTVHFRAAESIAEGYLPPRWASEIERRLWFQRWLPHAGSQTGTMFAIDKLDRLKRFFAASPFFADAEAKRLLLDKLDATRQRWEEMSWEQLRKLVPP